MPPAGWHIPCLSTEYMLQDTDEQAAGMCATYENVWSLYAHKTSASAVKVPVLVQRPEQKNTVRNLRQGCHRRSVAADRHGDVISQ